MYKAMNHKHNTKDESGLVSIVVVSIIIVILSLMSIGFSRVMDREFRQSVDRELSIQADYAAESGMNDARAYILNKVENGESLPTGGGCLPLASPSAEFVTNGSISGTHTSGNDTAKYSCVIINPKPRELVYKIEKGKSAVFKLTSDTALQKLFFGWENLNPGVADDGSACFDPLTNSYPSLPKESDLTNACATGLLRVGIYPVPASLGSDPNADIASESKSFFLYPQKDNTAGRVGVANYSSTNPFVSGLCNVTNRTALPAALPNRQAHSHYCNSEITNLVPAPPLAAPAYTATKDGWPGSPCEPLIRPGGPVADANGNYPCERDGNSIYALQDYSSTYPFGGAPDGDYRLTLRYSNFRLTTWPPLRCDSYSFNVNVLVDGVVKKSNWRLSPCRSSDTTVLGGLSSNPKITIEWTNNQWVPSGSNPMAYDPNFEINRLTLDQIVAPPPAPEAPAFYYVSLTALYRDLNVSVQASGSGADPLELGGAEATVDVTGEGNNVLKRLQGYVTLAPDKEVPTYTIQSIDTLCKKLRLPKTGAGAASYGRAGYEDPDSGDAFVSGACGAGGVLNLLPN